MAEIEDMSPEQLRARFQELGHPVGPITDQTIKLYQRKMRRLIESTESRMQSATSDTGAERSKPRKSPCKSTPATSDVGNAEDDYLGEESYEYTPQIHETGMYPTLDAADEPPLMARRRLHRRSNEAIPKPRGADVTNYGEQTSGGLWRRVLIMALLLFLIVFLVMFGRRVVTDLQRGFDILDEPAGEDAQHTEQFA